MFVMRLLSRVIDRHNILNISSNRILNHYIVKFYDELNTNRIPSTFWGRGVEQVTGE